MKGYKLSKVKIMDLFDSINIEEFDKYNDFYAVDEGNTDYPYTIYARLKNGQLMNFAQDELTRESLPRFIDQRHNKMVNIR